MKRRMLVSLAVVLTTVIPVATSGDESLDFHEDYYLGFSQGVYYGLMLAGTGYEVAWCMKSELDYTGSAIGTGGDFQAAMEAILAACRENPVPGN